MAGFACVDVITWLDASFVYSGIKLTAQSSLELLLMGAEWLADGCNG
jgi:hypothetical protein